jgi:hypothetical protein
MSVDESVTSEVVNLADIAVRTASQIRLVQSGREFTEPNVLVKAGEFLTRAKKGGIFISGRSADLHDTLRPLNWATDAYLAIVPKQADFDQISDYLDQVHSSLDEATKQQSNASPAALVLALTFFEKLGELLGTEADKLLCDDTDLLSLSLH